MRETDLQAVRNLDLFAGMAGTGFEELMRASFLQRFPPGVELLREGETCDFLHVVVEGLVELYGTSNGRHSTLTLALPVSTFILAAAIKDSVYLMAARTLATSRVLMVPASSIREAFDQDTAFARAVVRELSTSYRRLVRALKSQKLRTGTERLASCLLRLDQDQGGRGRVELPIEKRTLASLLGMTPENLSRAFAQLAEHGVTVDGPQIALNDPVALARLAKPDSLMDGID